MRNIAAALTLLALLTLTACATTPEMEGPPTAFRLTSPGMAEDRKSTRLNSSH